MKILCSIAIVASSIFSACAAADELNPLDKTHRQTYCIFLANAYASSIIARDMETPPQMAYAFLQRGDHTLPPEISKTIVNLVYFDPSFINATSEAVRAQVMGECMGTHKDWKPIQ